MDYTLKTNPFLHIFFCVTKYKDLVFKVTAHTYFETTETISVVEFYCLVKRCYKGNSLINLFFRSIVKIVGALIQNVSNICVEASTVCRTTSAKTLF